MDEETVEVMSWIIPSPSLKLLQNTLQLAFQRYTFAATTNRKRVSGPYYLQLIDLLPLQSSSYIHRRRDY